MIPLKPGDRVRVYAYNGWITKATVQDLPAEVEHVMVRDDEGQTAYPVHIKAVRRLIKRPKPKQRVMWAPITNIGSCWGDLHDSRDAALNSSANVVGVVKLIMEEK